MKIAVFGWYGHDNAGDERIKYCVHKFLKNAGGVQSVDFFDLHENGVKGKTSRYDDYDLVIIGGGGLILSQCNYHDFIYGINTKLVTLGISVERPDLTGNAKKFAISLIEKSSEFLVRDKSSQQKLSTYDPQQKVKVSADLTFLEPYEVVQTAGKGTVGINLLPKPLHFKYSTLSTPIISFLLRQLSRFNLQELIKTIDFKEVIKQLETQFAILPIPLYCAPQAKNLPFYQKNDVNFLKQYFTDVPEKFVNSDIDKCFCFLSMRLHGAIFAVQKGIPVVSLSYLPKNKNFMKEVGLENLVVNSLNNYEISKAIEEVEKNYISIQNKMQDYREKATLQIRNDVTRILNSVSLG